MLTNITEFELDGVGVTALNHGATHTSMVILNQSPAYHKHVFGRVIGKIVMPPIAIFLNTNGAIYPQMAPLSF